MYKILIIAGEPSGDNLGSKLIKEMKIQFDEEFDPKNSQNKKLLFQGIGGPKMQNEGFVCLYKIEELSIMGFFDVFKSLRKIYSIIFAISNYTKAWKPDLIITIDSPDFCFRLVNKIRKIDKFVPIIHYVAPSVWAWRPKRAKQMSLLYDKVLALLPFEKPYFEKYGLSCDFVGHPISKVSIPLDSERENFFKTMEIDDSNEIINISFNTKYSKNVLAKNTTGSITDYQANVITFFTIKKRNNSENFEVNEKFNFKKIDDKYEEKNYEKNIKRNLANSISQKLILRLAMIK